MLHPRDDEGGDCSPAHRQTPKPTKSSSKVIEGSDGAVIPHPTEAPAGAPREAEAGPRVAYVVAGMAQRDVISRAGKLPAADRLASHEWAVLSAVLALTTGYSKLGDSLFSHELAELSGVSLGRTRKALCRLRELGLIEWEGARGRHRRSRVALVLESAEKWPTVGDFSEQSEPVKVADSGPPTEKSDAFSKKENAGELGVFFVRDESVSVGRGVRGEGEKSPDSPAGEQAAGAVLDALYRLDPEPRSWQRATIAQAFERDPQATAEAVRKAAMAGARNPWGYVAAIVKAEILGAENVVVLPVHRPPSRFGLDIAVERPDGSALSFRYFGFPGSEAAEAAVPLCLAELETFGMRVENATYELRPTSDRQEKFPAGYPAAAAATFPENRELASEVKSSH